MLRLIVTLVTLVVILPTIVLSFGNEYVHIKVHVPKEHEPESVPSPHKVIHHFHHHPRSRPRSPPPPPSHHHLSFKRYKNSPLLESVILTDLDKPLHGNDHTDYLNHAKMLAEHLTEAYAKKLPPPPPPPSPPRAIKSRPHALPPAEYHLTYPHLYRPHQHQQQQQHHHHHTHSQSTLTTGGRNHQLFKPSGKTSQLQSSSSPLPPKYYSGGGGGGGGYGEPAPVQESMESSEMAELAELDAPGYTVHTPDAELFKSYSNSDFRPSPQLNKPNDAEDDDSDTFLLPSHQHHHHHPQSHGDEVDGGGDGDGVGDDDWTHLIKDNNSNEATEPSYNDIYQHTHDASSISSYKYAGPYAPNHYLPH